MILFVERTPGNSFPLTYDREIYLPPVNLALAGACAVDLVGILLFDVQ